MKKRLNSKSALAKHWNVSITTIDAYLQQGMPVHSRGSHGVAYVFDLAEVERWRSSRKKPGATALNADFDDLPELLKRRPDFRNGARFTSEMAAQSFYESFFSGVGAYLLMNGQRIAGKTDEESLRELSALAGAMNLAFRLWVVHDSLNKRLQDSGSSIDDLWRLQSGKKSAATYPPSAPDNVPLPLPDWVHSLESFREFRDWAFTRFDEDAQR